MVKKSGNADKIKEILLENKVQSLRGIAEQVGVGDRMVQLYLQKLQGMTSYTHRGQFITLPGIPRFNEHGIWLFRGVGFSKYGTSLDTIVALVEESKEGFSRDELEAILKIGISKQIQILVQREKLHRVKFGSRYLYVPGEAMANKTRRLKIVGTRQTEERFDRDVQKADLIALLKAVLIEKRVGLDAKSIKNLVRKYALEISWNKVQLLLQRYDLLEKKTQ